MKIIYSLFLVLLFVACKGNTDAQVKTAPSHQKTATKDTAAKDLNQTSTTAQVTFNTPKYMDVYNAYLGVKAAMVNTDAGIAQNQAVQLSQALEGVSEVSDTTRKAVKSIIAGANIKEQRVAFEAVSKDVEIVLSQQLSSGTIYKQYCPMAFNGKGAYWLSDSKEVRNPYFGNQMLTCGVVDTELKKE